MCLESFGLKKTVEKLAPWAADNSNCCSVYLCIEIKDRVSCCILCKVQPLLIKGSSFPWYLDWDLIEIFQRVSKVGQSFNDSNFWQISSSAPETINLQGGEFAKPGEFPAHSECCSSLALCSSPEPISLQLMWESTKRAVPRLLCPMEHIYQHLINSNNS